MIKTHDAAARGAAPRRVALAAGLLALVSSPALAGASKIQGEGIASFYGRAEHGGPTASGERFNMHAMTAAHRTAPLGSRLKVTNLKNGKSVVVRINDRGPFVRGRVIDLSHAAADVLGFTGAGLTRVAIATADTDTSAEPIRVASLDPETTGSTPDRRTSRRAAATTEAKPTLSDADRMMIDRTGSSDR